MNIECKEKANIISDHFETVLQEKEAMLKQMADMEQRIVNHQQAEFEALQKAKEFMEQIDQVKFERDSIKSTEEARRKEVEQMESKVKKIKIEYSDKLKSLRAQLNNQYEQSALLLREECRKVETENVQLKNQLDRAVREKKTAEAEAAKVIKSAESEMSTPSVVSSLSKKMTLLSEERDEMERMYDQLRGSAKRQQIQWEQERENMNNQVTEAQKKAKKLEREIDTLRESKDRHIAEYDKVNKLFHDMQMEKEDLDRKLREKSVDYEKLQRQVAETRNEAERLQKRNEEIAIKITLLVKEKSEHLTIKDALEDVRYFAKY